MIAHHAYHFPANGDSTARRIADGNSPYHSVDEAVAAVIRSAGCISTLAERTKIPVRQLYRWSCSPENPSDYHRRPSAEAIEALTLATGRLDILQYLAERAGYALVPLEADESRVAVDYLAHASDVMRESSDVTRTVAEVLADGDVTVDERERLRSELFELSCATHTFSLSIPRAERKPLASAR